MIIMQGDNRQRLKEFPDNHFDSCVCDPPYELGFMGKAWDKSGIAYDVAMWKEVYRVLKPGAHLLAFGGSRTYHRLACAIEDAGFQVRDQIMWLYGSGFPKSLDVSKGIDKAAGAEREILGHGPHYCPGRKISKSWREHENRSDDGPRVDKLISAPATSLARQWEGWGTALKPAHEPIVVARKPLEGTVVANVLKHGTGAINVAGCRIEFDNNDTDSRVGTKDSQKGASGNPFDSGNNDGTVSTYKQDGRWPANVIHDGSPEVLAEFEKAGVLKSGSGTIRQKEGYFGAGDLRHGGLGNAGDAQVFYGDKGSPARFFYCAKASPSEKNLGCVKNNHPTVKPLALMAYLVRLVTPPGGVVLDPFMGSGSTLIAAAKEGFCAVGIELEVENCEIAERRCHGHLGMLAEVVNA